MSDDAEKPAPEAAPTEEAPAPASTETAEAAAPTEEAPPAAAETAEAAPTEQAAASVPAGEAASEAPKPEGEASAGAAPAAPASGENGVNEAREQRRRERKRKSGWDDVPATPAPVFPAPAAPLMQNLTPIQQEAIRAAQAMQLQKQGLSPGAMAQGMAGLGAGMGMAGGAMGMAGMGAAAATAGAGVPLGRLYVGSLHYDLKEPDLRAIFEPFGPIKAVDLSFEPATGKSKGFCFIEYFEAAHAEACYKALDGFLIAGRPIKIGRPHNVAMATGNQLTPGMNPMQQMGMGMPGMMGMGGMGMVPGMQQMQQLTPGMGGGGQTVGVVSPMAGMMGGMMGMQGMQGMVNPMHHAQAGLQQQQQQASALSAQAILQAQQKAAQAVAAAAAPKPQGPPSRIYVGSVYFEIGEKEIEHVFKAFGPVKNVSMIPNAETGKHKGYGFVEFETSEAAQQAIQVMNGFELGGRALKVGWANSALNAPAGFGQVEVGAANSAAIAAAAAVAAAAQLGLPGGAGAMAGMAMGGAGGAGAISAQSVQGNLAGEEHVSVNTAAQKAALMQKLMARPSKVVCLKNMVDAEEVDEQLEEEITEECSKYGSVTKVIIATLEEGGKKIVKIFVVFTEEAATAKAVQSLDKRWFGGKVVSAAAYDQDRFQRQDYTG